MRSHRRPGRRKAADAGRSSASSSRFTTSCFEVRLKADEQVFAQRLAAPGCTAESRDDLLFVQIPRGQSPQMLWQTAAEAEFSKFAISARSAARWKKSSSKPWSRPNADFRSGISTLVRQLSGHAWRWLTITRHGIRVGMKNRYCATILIAAWVPALALVVDAVPVGIGGTEIEPRRRLSSSSWTFFSPAWSPIRSIIRIDVWRLSYRYFLQSRTLVFDDPDSAGRAEPDQPGFALQRPAALFLPAAAADRLFRWESWA